MPRDDAVEHQKDQQEKLKDEEDEERGNERVTRGRRRRRRLAWARDLEQSSGLLSLPREVLLQILGRLSFRDLLAVRQASAYFEEVSRDPTLWREYEVSDDAINTTEVINDLKGMPFLKTIRISNRTDCDELIRQIALSNKNLEVLDISKCRGSLFNPYLRPAYLTRLLERCRRLRSVQFTGGTRFRGTKFYRLCSEAMPGRLCLLRTEATRAQFDAFVGRARCAAADEGQEERPDLMLSVSRARAYWAPMSCWLTWRVQRGKDRSRLIYISR